MTLEDVGPDNWRHYAALEVEMTLLIYPVVVGQGTRLFPDTGPDTALDLVESRSTPSGVTIQTYRAHHARDRSAAGGNASARATIWPVSSDLPAQLMHRRFQESQRLGSSTQTSPPESVGVYDLDDLAEDGPPLVAATYALTTGLFQGFGVPEALQLTRDGAVRINYWWGDRGELTAWASEAGIQISEETVN